MLSEMSAKFVRPSVIPLVNRLQGRIVVKIEHKMPSIRY
jgi:hypothetical protein